VHLESTFDPNATFTLTSPVVNPLFEFSHFRSPPSRLRVNAVGGGSWVTEFEVLTGLDSRLFGYAGQYAHSSLSPYVKTAFPAYLEAYGYRASAYYSWPGNFYHARQAFLKYGFAQFADVEDLALTTGSDFYKRADSRSEGTDARIAAAAVRKMSLIPATQPFFAFVGLTENHAPHPCRHFQAEAQFYTRFSKTDDFMLNCALNEYIRRLGSTARAFALLRAFLEERQTKTGRPFVLLGYGDHQPYSLTSVAHDRLRTAASMHETALVLESSVPGVLQRSLDVTIPATIIPSLLSAYVARDTGNLYLPVNFSLLARCGPDLMARNASQLPPGKNDGRRPGAIACAAAVESALPVLQQAGILHY
jgi:phosphoglycerol transferase MdoB-like AlkP superfamily enzyme